MIIVYYVGELNEERESLMRKWMIAFIAVLVMITLNACQDKATPTEGTADENTSDLTAEKVFEEALAVAEKMESAEIILDMQQTTETPDEGSMSSDGEFTVQMTMDPLLMYQKGSLTFEMAGIPPQDIHMEMYMTDDAIYLYEEDLGEWIKMDSHMSDLVDMLGAQQQDPAQELKMLEEYVEDLQFEQTDDTFIFKLDVDSDKFTTLMDELIDKALPPEMMEMFDEDDFDMTENMDINRLYYEMVFDKDSYEMITYDIDISMTLNIEDYEVTIDQVINSEYKNINNIDVIEVPQDVIDNAIDQSF